MQKKWKIMIILLTILIILYALTSCKEKIQEKKGNEDNWKVYQQLEEKEEQNIQNPFIREETKCILTEKEKQELRNQLLKIVTQCKDIYHPIIDQTTGYQSISREEVKKIKKRFGENGLVCVAENMNMENYEKVEEFYLDYLEDSFLIESAQRYDIKGKAYIETPKKYYFSDLGLRNARINFRQFEQTHSMENVIYNELRMRGYSVDVGVIPIAERNQEGKVVRKQLEVDFVCNLGSSRYYIQSAYSLPDEAKRTQEIRPFRKIDDSFKKIVITKDIVQPYYDDYGILTVNIYDFLLDPQILEK